MFNKELKDAALKLHNNAVEKYNQTYTLFSRSCEDLYSMRSDSIELIDRIEEVLNSIANKPVDFDAKLNKIKQEKLTFHTTEAYAKEAYENTVKAGVGTAAGIGTGVAVASFAPSAAMWVATTFGTASTGAAISSLSGAAATKAALAWLGGGALKAGGAGIVGGKALLALAGPIGWGIGGAALVGEGVFLAHKNKDIANKVTEEAKKVTAAGWHLNAANEAVKDIYKKTKNIYNNLLDLHKDCLRLKNSDYKSLDEADQYKLGGLVNDTLSLAELLNKTVDSDILG